MRNLAIVVTYNYILNNYNNMAIVNRTDWQVDEIKALLEKNDQFVAKCVVKIFDKQTEDEQKTDSTGHNNGIGFNGTDANIMSKFAKFYMEKNYLSPKQLAIARKRIMKYSKQLTKIANGQL